MNNLLRTGKRYNFTGFFAVLFVGIWVTMRTRYSRWNVDFTRNQDRMASRIPSRKLSPFEEFSDKYIAYHSRQLPARMEGWFDMAVAKECSLDESAYDLIYRNLQPFINLWESCVRMGECSIDDPVISAQQIAQAASVPETDRAGIREGQWFIENRQQYQDVYGSLLNDGSLACMPDVNITFNFDDNPMVLKREIDMNSQFSGLVSKNDEGINIVARPAQDAVEFFQEVCDAEAKDKVKNHAHFHAPLGIYTTDLVPIFTGTTFSPCFHDIVYPSFFAVLNYGLPDGPPIEWNDKKSAVGWRGSNTGVEGEDNNDFSIWHRHRLYEFSETVEIDGIDLDINFTRIIQCTPISCEKQRDMYPLGNAVSYSDLAHYRYVIDIDGNTYTGRTTNLLTKTSESLVIKGGIFEDWQVALLQPNEHVLEFDMDLSDLKEKLEWARDNQEEAQRIAKQGSDFARKNLRRDDAACFFSRLLLEYHRLTLPTQNR